jgi:hypothetical protein
VLFLSPTKELSTKTVENEVAGRVPCCIINEDKVGKGHVTAELVRHFKAPSGVVANLVFATHAIMPFLPFIANKRSVHVIVDEVMQVVQYASHRLPVTHPLITDGIQLDPYNAIYSRVVPQKSLTAKGRNKENDECLGVIAPTIRRLTNRYWHNYVNTEQYERLRNGQSQTLAFHSILAPDIFAGFASVFMTAANFEATMLYQLWGDWNGAEDAPFASQPSFFRDDDFINSLRFHAHHVTSPSL